MSNKYPAYFIAHTPTRAIFCCDAHAVKIRALFENLGLHIRVERIDDVQVCSNCRNKAPIHVLESV